MHHDARVIGVWKKMWYDTYTIRRAEAISDRQEQERTMNQHKQLFERLAAAAFWLAVWQCAAMAVGQEVFLVSPVQALRTLCSFCRRQSSGSGWASAPDASCWVLGWAWP